MRVCGWEDGREGQSGGVADETMPHDQRGGKVDTNEQDVSIN